MAAASSTFQGPYDWLYQVININQHLLDASQLAQLLPYIQGLLANEPTLVAVAGKLRVIHTENSAGFDLAECTRPDLLRKVQEVLTRAFNAIVYVPVISRPGTQNIPVMEFQVSSQGMQVLYHRFPECGFDQAIALIKEARICRL